MMHRCPDGTHSRLERRGPVGTLEGVTFHCQRCGYVRSAQQISDEFERARPAIIAALSSSPVTATVRVEGSALVGDIVAYEDRAYPRREYRVVRALGFDYELEPLEGGEPGRHFHCDLRQPGWTFAAVDR